MISIKCHGWVVDVQQDQGCVHMLRHSTNIQVSDWLWPLDLESREEGHLVSTSQQSLAPHRGRQSNWAQCPKVMWPRSAPMDACWLPQWEHMGWLFLESLLAFQSWVARRWLSRRCRWISWTVSTTCPQISHVRTRWTCCIAFTGSTPPPLTKRRAACISTGQTCPVLNLRLQ